MGFLDALKKLVPASAPMPWDERTIRHPRFSLRLPEGWRFTGADWRRATAVGPADHSAELYYQAQGQPGLTSKDVPKLLELARGLVRHDAGFKSTPAQSALPNGVLWTEASEVKGSEQGVVVYALKMDGAGIAQICLRTTVPVSSGKLGAERLEALRAMLREVDWK